MVDTPSAILVEARGHGSPIVFLPGYPLDHRIWSEQIRDLSDNHEVVLVDLPGFGADWRTPAPETLSGFSDAVAETLLSARQHPATIVGHSFGGYIALQLYKDHSELFDRLVLVSTRSAADTTEQRDKRLATATRLQTAGEGLDVEATAKGLVAERSWEANSTAARRAREIVLSARPEAVRGALRAMASRPDLTPLLESIKVPTLVVWGEEDRLIPPSETRALESGILGARGIGIPESGHLSMIESPKMFNDSIRSFLDAQPAA